ncbi:3-dehydroquinate synthase [Amylibacter sp. IMCC11727]|uniref:3-dehydroquinate synthase n=1 Tax=Amylibacter sp. IMCC11727 TaxID=3039851 RepID=UPI00244E23A0|nr:3-dehydroquinate synthase [Amylibacter sp. IMCC11727]WGI20318.1 3-dehydroquinate synthase [Amylibacter sp. IMCC11727]
MREQVHVALGTRSYDIEIGTDLLGQSGSFIAPMLQRKKVAIITDETVAGLHLTTLLEGLHAEGIEAVTLTLPAGEATKSWDNIQNSVEWLLAEKIERDDILIAFGGGVIGDLAGFAAAIVRRGIRFVQIPTTLLSQVDSSVGGKTGINSPHGKNLVGAFYQPQLVLADVSVLGTLTRRDYLAGYGEVAKYGLLGDATYWEWLEENASAAAEGDVAKRIYAVKRSCEMKANIVARDEQERGDRALLNLGHTFGHALEAATGYSDRLLHGEGVSIGCSLAFEVSQRLGFCSQEAPSRVREHFKAMGMKCDLSEIDGDLPDADGLIALMGQDKKVRAGVIGFIMARGLGDAFVTRDVDLSVVKDVLERALAQR